MDFAGDEIDAGQQADRAVALVLMLARPSSDGRRLGRQVRSGGSDRLNAGLLIIGDNRHPIALVHLRGARLLGSNRIAWLSVYLITKDLSAKVCH
jgi:hypothetical protein